ncbi:MAG TPA: hypothetical protein VL860_11445 [Planctomycetota bacterium]|nr:hypothetical protein [Planctomycetota bacterium]
MYYRFFAPPDFFESALVPQISLWSGRTDGIQPADLDLSFTFSGTPPAAIGGEAVVEMQAEAWLEEFRQGARRKGSRNLLFPVPAAPGEKMRWGLRYHWLPRLLLLFWPTLGTIGAVLVAPDVTLGLNSLAAGVMLGWAAYRFSVRGARLAVQFGVTRRGNVVVTMPASLEGVARQYQSAVEQFLRSAEALGAKTDGVKMAGGR